MNIAINSADRFEGTLSLPGDKSLSHRVLMFAAMAEGKSRAFGVSSGQDVMSTARCLSGLGIDIRRSGDEVVIEGKGLRGFQAPKSPLDCGNSGSTMRMLMGCLAGQSFPPTSWEMLRLVDVPWTEFLVP